MNEIETLDFDDEKTDHSLEVTNQIKENFRITAGWATFIAIFGFIMAGLIFLATIALIVLIGNSSFYRSNPIILMIFVYALMGITTIAMMVYLLKFANKIRKAVNHSHQHTFLEATESLKMHYKIMGIYISVGVGIYLIFILLSATRMI